MSNVLIVVPCFDEAERLDGDAFIEFVRTNESASVLFVDDGSRDGTASLLRDICASAPGSLELISLPKNCGKGEAVRRGMLEGLSREGTDLVGFWDADLATPLSAVADFVTVMDRDPSLLVCMGARAQLLGRRISRSAQRHYLGRVFATAASMVLRLPVYDTQCGAKLFRQDPAVRLVFATPFLSRWIFDVEVLARLGAVLGASSLRERVYELVLRQWEDVSGSKRSTSVYVIAIRDMWRIWRTMPRIEEGSEVIAEETPEGILIRPAMTVPIEVYADDRKAEFLLTNAVDAEDYRRAQEEVRRMGLDPSKIEHVRPADA